MQRGNSSSKTRGKRRGTTKSEGSVGARMSKLAASTPPNCHQILDQPIVHPGKLPSAITMHSGAPKIPEDVLDDLCVRFLINIPDDQKAQIMRVCYQIELAHWFYIDLYCKDESGRFDCSEINMRDFMRQIFSHCQFLAHNVNDVDTIMDRWKDYKSLVPTYGAALLDCSLNYVLLVQGYFSKSWGFPKGKVNEEEEPTECAIREVEEEVGYSIRDKISSKCSIRKAKSVLFIIKDVPIDFPFKPRTRNEIGKIQWFSVWDLPKDRSDTISQGIGMSANAFFTAIPFVQDLQSYIMAKKNAMISANESPKVFNFDKRSASAFTPVSRQGKNEQIAVFNTLFPNKNNCPVRVMAPEHTSNTAFFKPLTPPTQMSFTGTNFATTNEVARPVPKLADTILGSPVYVANRRKSSVKNENRANEVESDVWSNAQRYLPSFSGANKQSNEEIKIINEESSPQNTISEKFNPTKRELKIRDFVCNNVQLCDSWKSFTLDKLRKDFSM